MITPLYSAILALILVFLSFRTLRLRRKLSVPIGAGEQPELARAMSAHSNFVAYTPMALLLIYFLENRTHNLIPIHALCACLIIGRLLHAYGVSQLQENFKFRVAGMVLTFTSINFASIGLIASYFTEKVLF